MQVYDITGIATKTGMGLGSGTLVSDWAGVPIHDIGILLAGIGTLLAAVVGLLNYLRNKK